MVTFVGKQGSFADAVKNLIELDFDAVEAYETALNKMENNTYKKYLQGFKEDHERHIKELSALLTKHNEEPPHGPSSVKHWLTKGKVVMAEILGDDLILRALRSNEIDTLTAYRRMDERVDRWPDSESILHRGLEDEKRHNAWLEKQLSE